MSRFRSPLRTIALAALVLALAPISAQAALDAEQAALAHLARERATLGLAAGDLVDLAVRDRTRSARTGITHVHLQQRHAGIEIQGAVAAVHVDGAGSVVHATSRLSAGAAGRIDAVTPDIDAASASRRAAGALGIPSTALADIGVASREGGPARRQVLDAAGVSRRPIPARLVFAPVGSALRLAWELQIEPLEGSHYWVVTVDARTGAVLSRHDLVVHDAWPVARPGPSAAPAAGSAPPAAREGPSIAAGGGVYLALPLPTESPGHGPQVFHVDPADPIASPFGWHDIDGVAGAEFTDTRGNNVLAQEDLAGDNGNGVRVDGGPGLTFALAFDPGLPPGAPGNLGAALVNLFYMNNVVHDRLYHYGFDEASGNFQLNNYGRGGVPLDAVWADAQDGSGTNNASFLTLPEGLAPHMQMFVWQSPFPNVVEVTTPAPIAGLYRASGATFGPGLDATGVGGALYRADDGVGQGGDACEPLPPATDPVALVDRGGCTFALKVKNAQDAGAAAVVVVNDSPEDPFTMGGDDPAITIPSVMVAQADGAVLAGALPGVTATLRDAGASMPDRDSDLDNGIVIHEYVHGLSNRLTGGPAAAFCLLNEEQMGEGWSDFYAMAFTTPPGATAERPRGVGTYVLFQETDGTGIRPAPYSRDLAVNPYTYANRGDAEISVPHGVGFLWSSMLWDLYWDLVDRHGFDPDPSGDWTTGGNHLAIQLVTDAMKLQPCGPGFVDGRNAILVADQLLTGGAHQCEIWRAFARRGLGLSADQGEPTSRSDGVAAFDVPSACDPVTPLLELDSVLWTESGVSQGSFDFFADGSFVDAAGDAGNFTVGPGSPVGLLLDYDAGLACDGLWVATLDPAGFFVGVRVCQDGVGETGIFVLVPGS